MEQKQAQVAKIAQFSTKLLYLIFGIFHAIPNCFVYKNGPCVHAALLLLHCFTQSKSVSRTLFHILCCGQNTRLLKILKY
jgi:hypothetical protein